jgi:hypothetical protein
MLKLNKRQIYTFVDEFGIYGLLFASGQQSFLPLRDRLSPSEQQSVSTIEDAISKHLRGLQRRTHVRVMSRLSATERNIKLVCALARQGKLAEREGSDVGVVSTNPRIRTTIVHLSNSLLFLCGVSTVNMVSTTSMWPFGPFVIRRKEATMQSELRCDKSFTGTGLILISPTIH